MAKSITVGTSSRRRDRRVLVPPLAIELDRRTYETTDWSLGGFRITGYSGPRLVEDEVVVRVRGELRGQELGGAVSARVVRRGPAPGELACAFLRFEGDAWDQLEQLSVRRLRRPIAV